jgi:hypothetical protein
MPEVSAREALSSALRYWEPRRLLYNAVLLGVVAAIFVVNLPGSRANLTLDTMLILIVLAVLANVAYCAAYLVDILAQLSSFRSQWLRFRWVLLLIGLIFASILASFFARGFFSSTG